MPPQPKNIVIVGGSLAGLLCGNTLKSLGHKITILERSPSTQLAHQGAGIVFGPHAQEFFSRPTYCPARRDLSVSSYVRQTLRRDGSVLESEEREQKMVSWDLLYSILKAGFDGTDGNGHVDDPREKESENGVGSKYLYGKKVVGIRDLGREGGVELEIEDAEGGKEKMVADLVLAADGPSSTIRSILMPEVKRVYAGYVAWRGTVLESQASPALLKTFVNKFTFFHGPGIQILVYLIPGEKGSLEEGKRLINWVWYCNYPEHSSEYQNLMTDTSGQHHRFTLPVDKIQPSLWDQQKSHAAKVLPAVFAELVQSTNQPFIQAITDVISPQVSFFDGKVYLVGDALAGFRPHTAASTNQAAFHALLMGRWFEGGIGEGEMTNTMLDYARRTQRAGVMMGERSQFGSLSGEES